MREQQPTPKIKQRARHWRTRRQAKQQAIVELRRHANQHHMRDQRRSIERQLERDHTAVRVCQQRQRRLELARHDQLAQIVEHAWQRIIALDRRRIAVAAQVGRDDTIALREMADLWQPLLFGAPDAMNAQQRRLRHVQALAWAVVEHAHRERRGAGQRNRDRLSHGTAQARAEPSPENRAARDKTQPDDHPSAYAVRAG